jgi:hypothetical protein
MFLLKNTSSFFPLPSPEKSLPSRSQADLFIVQPVPKTELINASETPHTSFPNV